MQFAAGQRSIPVLPIIAGVCAVLALAGSIGPWGRALFVQVNGTDGDGRFSLVLGLIALGLLAARIAVPSSARVFAILAAVALGLVGAVGGINCIDILSKASDSEGLIEIGWGVVLVAIAGVAGCALAIVDAIQARPASSAGNPYAGGYAAGQSPYEGYGNNAVQGYGGASPYGGANANAGYGSYGQSPAQPTGYNPYGSATCARCGAVISSAVSFCVTCGAPVPAAQTQAAPEPYDTSAHPGSTRIVPDAYSPQAAGYDQTMVAPPNWSPDPSAAPPAPSSGSEGHNPGAGFTWKRVD